MTRPFCRLHYTRNIKEKSLNQGVFEIRTNYDIAGNSKTVAKVDRDFEHYRQLSEFKMEVRKFSECGRNTESVFIYKPNLTTCTEM